MLGLSACGLLVTNFSWQINLGTLEYGLKMDCSQLRECYIMRKKYGSCLPIKFIQEYWMNIIFETTKILVYYVCLLSVITHWITETRDHCHSTVCLLHLSLLSFPFSAMVSSHCSAASALFFFVSFSLSYFLVFVAQ